MSEAEVKPLPKGGLTWFEIPTGDIDRAAAFFRAVLAAPLIDVSHDEPMYMFPNYGGDVSGAIVQRTGRGAMKPSGTGTLVYLRVEGTACVYAPDAETPAQTRSDFRQFRLDRMAAVRAMDECFVSKRGQRLSDFLRQVRLQARRQEPLR